MKLKIMILLAAVFLSAPAFAASTTASPQYTAAKKAAAARYADDKKLCAEETGSSARMQCLRDAKAEYNKALAAAKSEHGVASSSSKVCAECGKVLSVNVVEKEGESSPLGLVAGGVAGALLGHQVGGGSGKDIATIAGAAGGAYAGHKIEQKMKSVKIWKVAVRFENGEEKTYDFDKDPGFVAGSAVKASNGSIVPR